MQFRKLLQDEDAVSPVIGVILMVAITVILAAVIASFVLGLGSTQENAPNMVFNYDLGEQDSDGDDELEISVDSGEVSSDRLTIDLTHGGTDMEGKWHEFASYGSTDISAGDSVIVGDSGSGADNDENIQSDWEVTITWESEGGDSTSTLSEESGPDA